MKNVVKKLNWVLPNVTSKIWTKSILPMVCALNNCFCHQKKKAEMNFTQSMGFAGFNFQNLYKKYLAYGVRTKLLFLLSKRQNEFYLKKLQKYRQF